MTDDNPSLFPILFCSFLLGSFAGAIIVMATGGGKVEEQTVVYCVEQPSACKIKYDYYKLENSK